MFIWPFYFIFWFVIYFVINLFNFKEISLFFKLSRERGLADLSPLFAPLIYETDFAWLLCTSLILWLIEKESISFDVQFLVCLSISCALVACTTRVFRGEREQNGLWVEVVIVHTFCIIVFVSSHTVLTADSLMLVL